MLTEILSDLWQSLNANSSQQVEIEYQFVHLPPSFNPRPPLCGSCRCLVFVLHFNRVSVSWKHMCMCILQFCMKYLPKQFKHEFWICNHKVWQRSYEYIQDFTLARHWLVALCHCVLLLLAQWLMTRIQCCLQRKISLLIAIIASNHL